MKKNKFKQGKRLLTVQQVINQITKKRFIFMGHKPYHYGWTMNWAISDIARYITTQGIFIAKENKQ